MVLKRVLIPMFLQRPRTAGRRALVVAFLASALVPVLSAQDKPRPGEVHLPLKDYLALVESAERAEREKARQAALRETPLAEVVAQRLSVTLGDAEAELLAEFEVLVQGTPARPVRLPVAGFLARAEVRSAAGPANGAAVSGAAEGGGVLLAAPEPGRYTVRISGRTPIERSGGVGSLRLPAVVAPVSSTEVDLPAEASWSCPGAVVVEEREQGARRRVRLAARHGESQTLLLRRRIDSSEADRLLAQTVVLTILQLRPEGPQRHDVVLYDVQRGSLDRFSVELPPGVEVEQAATDEGPVVPVVEDGRLTLHRRRQLQGIGYLVLTSTPPAQTQTQGLALDAVRPGLEARSRFLAIASSVAADIRPLPEAGWGRVDLDDLPTALSEALAALDLSAAWRLNGDPAGARLAVAPLPRAPLLDATIRLRESTTLLTVDGTLLHRDVFTVEARTRIGAALDMVLPPGAALWSARVDDRAVRPLERNGAVAVPLGAGKRGDVVVDVVSVQERAIPPGRSRLSLELAQVRLPVLDHRWRVLLPQGPRFRFREGNLRPVPEAEMLRELDEDFDGFEEIRVTGETPLEPPAEKIPTARDPWKALQSTPGVLADRINVGGNEAGQQSYYVQQTQSLQASVGGVKPLPVTIPETGKVLLMAGILPPGQVTAELEVRAKR